MHESLQDVLNAAVDAAVRRAAVRAEVPIASERAGEAAAAVTAEMARELQRSPVIRHVTNSEPWYQSRVTIGALVGLLSGVSGLAGYALDADELATLTNGILGAGAVVGAIITLIGRWQARRPIGAV